MMAAKNNPGAPNSFPDILSSLQKSCQSLHKLNSNLSSSTRSIELQTQDIPRINQVLKNSQFFELVSVSEIRAAQYQLSSELEPQLKELVKLSENGIYKLQRREEMLRNNISKRKNNLTDEKMRGEASTNSAKQAQSTTTEESSDDENLTRGGEIMLENLGSQKKLLLKELDKLDQELIKKQNLLKCFN